MQAIIIAQEFPFPSEGSGFQVVMNAVAKTGGSLLKQKVETVAVIVGKEDGLTAVTPKNDMVKPAGEMYTWFACHEANMPPCFNLTIWKPDPDVP